MTHPERYCLACEKLGHLTTECHSTHGLNTPAARELFRVIRAASDLQQAAEPITESQAIQLWHLAGEAHNRTSAFEWFAAGILAAELFHKVIAPPDDRTPEERSQRAALGL